MMQPQEQPYELEPVAHDAGAMAVLGPRIFLADPDPLMRTLLGDYLRSKGFDVIAATNMEAPPPTVDVLIIVVDGMQQRMDRPGWLSEKPTIPTIALDRTHQRPGHAASLGFAPDSRPSSLNQPRKLVAAIRRALSLARVGSVDPSEASVRKYCFSGWTLHCHERRLESPEGESIRLGKKEFEVLKTFLVYPRQLLTREQFIAIVWGSSTEADNRRLDSQISRLRRHLGDDAKFPALLKTLAGVGYRLDADVEKML
jgi:two-component system OmpR family response regulator